MNTKAIGVYSKIKSKNEKQNNSKEINTQSKKPQSNISIIIKFPIQNKTTKHSPETRDLSENLMKNMKQTQFKKKQKTNINNQREQILLKKKKTNILPIGTINLVKVKQKKSKSKDKQSTTVLKYIDSLMRKATPKPFTSTHTRKTSKEKYYNKKTKAAQQSSSIGKLKKNYYVNTSELKNLLSQYSIISRLSSHSNNKKKTNSKNKTESSNLTAKNYSCNKNNAVCYLSHSKNSHNVTINSTNEKKNNTIKKGTINQINKRKKGTISYNSVNKKLNYPKPMGMQINQPYLHTITPTHLQTNKMINVSTNPINKNGAGTVCHITRRNMPKNKQKKSSIEEMIKHFTYYKLLKQSISHLTSSNSITQNNIIKKRHFNNNNYPKIRDNLYYSNESISLSKYIQDYYNSHSCEYPSTSLKFYKIGRLIGHGAFGKVNICLHILTGRIIAIKSFNKSKHLLSKKKIQYEIKLMKKLKFHKNIIKVYEEIENEKYHCIVMEYINGGNLLSLIHKQSKLSEEIAYFIFRQLIEALSFIHSQGIVHRDIKPDNILIDLNNNIKICDFGIGKEIEPGAFIQDSCGTPAFTAPELYKDEPYDPYKSDIWSCGVVLYSMLSDSFPFRGNNDHELHQSILSGKYHKINHLSPSCSNLLHQILEVNPLERISIEKILSHPWMTKNMTHQKPHQIQLFTNAEKIIYSKISIDYRKGTREDLIEAFTYRNIDTEFENENRNRKTQSFIYTPPNSIIINIDDEDLYYSDLRIENKTMKFSPNINNLNQNYEINFNKETDQGQFIAHKVNHFKRQMISLHNSNDNIIKESHSNNSIVNQITHQNLSPNRIWNNKKIKIKDSLITSFNTYYIDENIVKQVEEYGYNREYIIKSLESNALNHSSATYFILLNSIALCNE